MSWWDEQYDPYGQPRIDAPGQKTRTRTGGGPQVYDQNGNPVGTTEPTSGTLGGGVNFQPHAAATGQTGQGGGYQPYSDALFLEIAHRYPPTYEGVQAAADEMNRVFGPGVVSLLEHPTKHDKFRLPNGMVADMVNSAGGANASWTNGINYEHGGGGAVGALGGMLGSGNVAEDPSFQFRLQEGQKALERSAAAKGTLMTGGFSKALTRYAQDYASGEYQNIFNRLFSVSNMGLNAAQGAAGVGSTYSNNVGQNNANYANQYGDLVTGQGNAQAAGQIGSSNAWGGTIGDLANIGSQWWERRNMKRDGGAGDYGYNAGGRG